MGVLLAKTIAVYDDSFEPTGTIHWHGIEPHIEMKKLRHELSLTIEGPDDTKEAILNCLKQAGVASALSATVAAFAGAGIGATPAAWDLFRNAFLTWAGQQVNARLDDQSHWITWDT
jgi:hypothetical protein